MKTFSIEMPQVAKCEVTRCVYNLKDGCHARAITVGDKKSALCDTFFDASPHNKRRDVAGVGACKVTACSNNRDYECQADAVQIGFRDNRAICMTFATP